jgi:hypothetical protein
MRGSSLSTADGFASPDGWCPSLCARSGRSHALDASARAMSTGAKVLFFDIVHRLRHRTALPKRRGAAVGGGAHRAGGLPPGLRASSLPAAVPLLVSDGGVVGDVLPLGEVPLGGVVPLDGGVLPLGGDVPLGGVLPLGGVPLLVDEASPAF